MREQLRGYAAAVLGAAREAGTLDRVSRELGMLAAAVIDSEALFGALCDAALGVASRRAVVEDLLAGADPAAARLGAQVVVLEREGEVPPSMEWLAARAAEELASEREGRAGPPADPPAGRTATKQRLEGFAAAMFESMADRADIDEVEDDLFRFARTLEGSAELLGVLSDPAVELSVREGIVADLLGATAAPGAPGRARAVTARLVAYAVATSRARGLVELLDWLVERAAAERGLRVAQVRSAVELDEGQRQRLAGSLARLTGRPVELRVRLDASLVGGMVVVVGDTVIDGTLRHRLDRLRVELAAGSPLRPAGPAIGQA